MNCFKGNRDVGDQFLIVTCCVVLYAWLRVQANLFHSHQGPASLKAPTTNRPNVMCLDKIIRKYDASNTFPSYLSP